jgi:hypothetical protein
VDLAVDHEAAHAADPLAAVVVERDALAPLGHEALVQHVQHLEEGHVRRDARQATDLEGALALGALLTPDVQRQVDGVGVVVSAHYL